MTDYNTENGATAQELSDQQPRKKSPNSGKNILLLEIELKESKKQKSCQKLQELISQSPQYNQNWQSQSSASRANAFTRKHFKNHSYMKIK